MYMVRCVRASQGEPAVCTLICRPSDFDEHEAHVRSDGGRGDISPEAMARQLKSLEAERTFAANVTHCRWLMWAAQYEQSELMDAECRKVVACGKCDNCVAREKEGCQWVDFGDVAIFILLIVQDVTEQEAANWTKIKEKIQESRGSLCTSRIGQVYNQLKVKWSNMWSYDRLRLLLAMLCEQQADLAQPFLHRTCCMRKTQYGMNVSTTYKLSAAGVAFLRRWEEDESEYDQGCHPNLVTYYPCRREYFRPTTPGTTQQMYRAR